MTKIKGPIIDTNNHLNGIFPSFNSLSYEFSPGTWLIDTFPSYFLFCHANCENKKSRTTHIHKLNEYVFCASTNSKSVVVVSDASIKNTIAVSIAHVHLYLNPVKKTIHHAVNIISIEAELFTIRCGINQAIQISDVTHIIIIIDVMYTAHHIFDSSIHPYQH